MLFHVATCAQDYAVIDFIFPGQPTRFVAGVMNMQVVLSATPFAFVVCPFQALLSVLQPLIALVQVVAPLDAQG